MKHTFHLLTRYLITFSFATLAIAVQADSLTLSEAELKTVIAATRAETATLNYWTRDNMAAATAMVMIDSGTDEPAAAAEAETPIFLGVPASSSNGMAAMGSDELHQQVYPQDWSTLDEVDWGSVYLEGETSSKTNAVQALGTSGVYTNFDVNVKTALWKLYPHRWVGKFFFRTASGNASCSATAISRNHILTAAHCVYNTASNVWYTRKAFSPTYRNGNRPYGSFATTGCTILAAWRNLSGGYNINTWARHDVAVCNAGKNSAGRTLNQAVGWAGRAWNWGYTQLHFNSGYPARNYRDILLGGPAQYLRACIAESFRRAVDTLGSGCFYGRGISGGSWMLRYRPNYTTGSVNSVNSGLILNQQNLYGARFSNNNIVPICNATAC